MERDAKRQGMEETGTISIKEIKLPLRAVKRNKKLEFARKELERPTKLPKYRVQIFQNQLQWTITNVMMDHYRCKSGYVFLLFNKTSLPTKYFFSVLIFLT